MSKPYISVMFFYPVLHCSPCFAYQYKFLINTNFLASRHIVREKTSLPVDVRRSKTSLLKLPSVSGKPLLFQSKL